MNSRTSSTSGRLIGTIGLLACVLSINCDDGPSAPSTPNIAGAWQGTYRAGIGANFDPCDNGGPVSATFRQDGSHVEGTLTPQFPSLAQGTFVGELRGEQLLGTLTNGGSSRTLGGTATADRMSLSLDVPFCSRNSVELHR